MKPTGFHCRAATLLLVLVLPGCAVGPDYHRPAAPKVALTAKPLPSATVAAGGVAQHFKPGADIPGDWWTLYHSKALDGLVKAALAHNPSLAAAQATLTQAEETVRADEGVLLPSLSGDLSTQRQKASAATAGKVGAYTLYNASFAVSYTFDLFGGARRAVESVAAQAHYQREQLEAAYLTLTTNIVTAAIHEASLKAQITATRQLIADEQQLLDILQAQVQAGGAAPAQLLQQQAQLAQQEATLPPLQSQEAQARNQLAAYAGAFPGDFHMADFALDDLHLPENVPVSLPSAIVAQRPDIRAAAAQLHEASANVGVADAQMLPRITLSAGIGHEALTTGSLFTPQTLIWNLAAGLTQPLFEGGTLNAKRKAALAALRGAAANYQGTVINAFQNVADVLAALQYDAAELKAADKARSAAAQSLKVTEAQYKLGAQPFSAVLTAETTYQSAVLTDVKAQATRLADTAALYQALGGGWWHRHDVAVSCCGIVP